MQLIDRTERTLIALLSSLLLIVPSAFPFVAFAEDCVTTSAPQGTQTPRGSDAETYSYNSCGYWENEHFTWNPVSFVVTPKDTATYNYNDTTGKCDYQVWTWSPATSQWYQVTESVTTPPNDADCVGKPAPQAVVATPTVTEPENTVQTNSNNNQSVNDTNNATLENTVTSGATSGNAVLLGNVGPLGSLGGATSGSAQAIANVFNLLQSSSSMGANVATFVANVNGDVQGDLIIDPSQLQPASVASSLNNDVDVTIANNGSITNDIKLAALSGDATVTENVNAGDANSGSAQAIANVVNMMNSLVTANQSFLGVININGNLNGNILMPQNFLDALIASNAPHETVAVSQDTINKLSADVSNDTAIMNNVYSDAESGNATAEYNTNDGPLSSASSGSAQTNVTIFNLANNQITGGNTMLVFVNVLGKWVGVIMNAPAGATAAALGGGVTATASSNNDVDYDISNKGTITNNIDVSAKTGDATLSKNVNAGNAHSGNASTAVNLANLTNDTVNLTGWFGILFINVFGNWFGNFGVNQPPVTETFASSANGGTGVPARVFGFVPKPKVSSFVTPSSAVSGTSSAEDSANIDAQIQQVAAAVLGDTTGPLGPHSGVPQSVEQGVNQARVIGAALVAVGLIIFAINFVQARRSSSTASAGAKA